MLSDLKLARAAYTNKISDNLDSTEEVFAVGDPDRLVQCLENLIGNAVKYSDLDTPIALEVKTNPEYIEVSIIDSGQGIPADEQDLIFVLSEVGIGSKFTIKLPRFNSGL